MAAQTLNDLSRFLPGALVQWAARSAADSPQNQRETHVGALMITDVSGFTRLTAKLSRDSGQVGAEQIGHVLNDFVSRLIGTVERLGGAILSFEGNSLMAGWKSEPGARSPGPVFRQFGEVAAVPCPCGAKWAKQ